MCNLPFTKVRLAVQPLNQEILNLKDEELHEMYGKCYM